MNRLKKIADIQQEIQQGDLINFGPYGKLYVCDPNYSDKYFWVTDKESDRNNRDAQGWSINKSCAESIIESLERDEYDEEEMFF